MRPPLSLRQYIRFSVEEGVRYVATYALNRTRDVLVVSILLLDEAIKLSLPKDIQGMSREDVMVVNNEQ